MARRNHAELLEHLDEQLAFLRSSAQQFDAGNEVEAKRMATGVRLLVHDTRASVSLLAQLAAKRKVPWRDSNILPGVDIRRALVTTCPLVVIGDGRYWPACESYSVTAEAPVVTFDTWWHGVVAVAPQHDERFSRRDLVLALANKHGGAHVDPRPMSSAYERLARTNFLEFEVVEAPGGGLSDFEPPGRPVEGNVAFAAVRQITDEVLAALDDAVASTVLSASRSER